MGKRAFFDGPGMAVRNWQPYLHCIFLFIVRENSFMLWRSLC